MTKSELIKSKNFQRFMALEYGYEIEMLDTLTKWECITYMIEWLQRGSLIGGITESQKKRVSDCLKNRSFRL